MKVRVMDTVRVRVMVSVGEGKGSEGKLFLWVFLPVALS